MITPVLLSCALLTRDVAIDADDQGRLRGYKVVVLSVEGRIESSARSLEQRLSKAGFTVRVNPARNLKWDSIDCLIVPRASAFPAPLFSGLLAYLNRGKDLVLLGDRPFSEPLNLVGSSWRSDAEVVKSLHAHPLALAGWTRAASNPNAPSKAVSDGSSTEFRFRETRNWQYDVFASQLSNLPSPGDDTLVFEAKASERTHQFEVELDERDGSRWRTSVDVGSAWRKTGVSTSSFRFHADGSPTGRGGPGDRLRLDQVNKVSIGLIADQNFYEFGSNTVSVRKLGSCYSGIRLGQKLAFETAEIDPLNELHEVATVVAAQRQDVLPPTVVGPTRGDGVSAIQYPLKNQSAFYPLLEARDQHGRSLGWAASMLVHYAGEYTGSQWATFGLSAPSFYDSTVFVETLVPVLRRMGSKSLVKLASQQNTQSRSRHLSIVSPPLPRISVSADGRHLVRSDGSRFFCVGANYLGPSDRVANLNSEDFDAGKTESDFAAAHRAGINVFRIWLNGYGGDFPIAQRDTLIECARRNGIYLIVHIGAGASEIGQIAETCRKFGETFKGETSVMGFDLINEPHPTTVAGVTFQGEKSPLLRLRAYERFPGAFDKAWVDNAVVNRPGWPPISGNIHEKRDLQNLWAALNILEKDNSRYGFPVPRKFVSAYESSPADDPWKQVAVATNATFDDWLRPQIKALKDADPHFLISVGYDRAVAMLPCNDRLDFLTHHLYGVASDGRDPDPRWRTKDLAELAAVWRKPITMGEFGYTNGDVRPGGNGYTDAYASAVGEMAQLLLSMTQGLDGGMKWMLTDWPVANQRDCAFWIGAGDREENSRYGILGCDGTVRGRPKPVAHATRVFREFVDRGHLAGDLRVFDAKNRVKSDYVFSAPGALFVGATLRTEGPLRFIADHPANVMLLWGNTALQVTSTAHCRASIRLQSFLAGTPPNTATLTGLHGAVRVEGPNLIIELLEGETVSIRSTQRKTSR